MRRICKIKEKLAPAMLGLAYGSVILLFTLLFTCLHIKYFHCFVRSPQAADVIIVLGCAAPNGRVLANSELKMRLDEAVKLYNANLAPYIIVSGGDGGYFYTTEALAMKDYLLNAGIATEKILLEENSHTTWQNLAYIKPIMERYKMQSSIIVSSPLHLARVAVTTKRLGYKKVKLSYNQTTFYDEYREYLAFFGYDLFYYKDENIFIRFFKRTLPNYDGR